MKRLGFIGCGVITEAIVTGLKRAGRDDLSILLSPRNAEIAGRLAAAFTGVRVAGDNQKVVDDSDIVILAIRPQVAQEVVTALSFRPGQHVVSLIAATGREALTSWIAAPVRITRAIPLPFVAALQGATAIWPPDEVVSDLFAPLGTAVVVDDPAHFDLLAAASALMGTWFGVLETAATWLTRKGLPPDQSDAYLRQLVSGLTQAMLAAPEASFASLRASHSTRGGLNEQVFDRFAQGGGAVAVEAALDLVLARIIGAA